MPPSLRRRGRRSAQAPPPSLSPPAAPHGQQYRHTRADSEDSDDAEGEEQDLNGAGDAEGEERDGDEDSEGDEDREDEDEEGLEPPSQPPTTIPPHLREISSLASWTVSSSKPGCSIPQLRSPNTTLFWQSDGPQPHYLNIHFFKLVRIVGLRLYLDFEADESYTPTRIVFLAGSGGNDLQEWGEMRLEQPRGWVWVDFEGVGEGSEDEEEDGADDDDDEGPERVLPGTFPSTSTSFPGTIDTTPLPSHTHTHTHTVIPSSSAPPNPSQPSPSHPKSQAQSSPSKHPKPKSTKTTTLPVLRAHLVQIKILENHQNGKDTHLRGLQIFARDNDRGKGKSGAAESHGAGVRREGEGTMAGTGRRSEIVVGRRRLGMGSLMDLDDCIR